MTPYNPALLTQCLPLFKLLTIMSQPPQQPPSQLPPNPKDDNASVQAALNKLHTLRKLSMSGTGGFTPMPSQPGTASVSRASSAAPSRATSRPGSPGEDVPNVTIDVGTPGPSGRMDLDLNMTNKAGADYTSPGALSPGEAARPFSVPGTPHFGAQTDMLKTLDESTKVIKKSQSNKMSGTQTPSVSGIGTLLDRPDYSEAKIVVAMVSLGHEK